MTKITGRLIMGRLACAGVAMTLSLACLGDAKTACECSVEDSRKPDPPVGLPVRFGVVTDIHFADIPDVVGEGQGVAGKRYYRESKSKVDKAVAAFNRMNLDFVLELGDLKDLSKDKATTLKCLDEIEGSLKAFRGPCYHAVGNHDFDCLTPEEFMSHVTNGGKPMTRGYYSFDVKGVRFLVLDACYDSEMRHYSRCNPWTDSNVPKEELVWIEHELATASKPVVVFCHQRLDTAAAPKHDVRNAAAVRAVLEKSGKVVAVITGHEHMGGTDKVNGIPYYSLKGMICGTGEFACHYAELTVEANGEVRVTEHP